jgi:hypothetical protein
VNVGVNVGVGVGVSVGVNVGVFVAVFVGVWVGVLVAVFVGVCVGVLVEAVVGVGVMVGVDVAVAVGAGVGVLVATALNVTVRAPLEPITTWHGLFVPVQPGGGLAVRLLWPLQPAKVEPGPAVARNVATALLSDVLMLGEQVLVTVCDVAPDPDPPHPEGAFTVPELTPMVTEPLPVPANVSVQLRASVKAPVSLTPDIEPFAM